MHVNKIDSRIIADDGINWCWFIGADFDFEEKTVTIRFYDRYRRGDEWPEALMAAYRSPGDRFEGNDGFMEDSKREAYGLVYRGIEFLILNPGPVFEYKDFSQLKLKVAKSTTAGV